MKFLPLVLWFAIAAQAQTISLWPTQLPSTPDSGSDNSVELGTRFTSDVAGSLTGIRFYKAPTNTGTHTVAVWNSSGTKLAQQTATNEPSFGWVTVTLTTPIAIAAKSTYTVSYHCKSGHYSDDQNYFATAFANLPLHVPVGGGRYRYGSTPSYPNSTWNNSNYWVDVLFVPGTSPPPPVAITISPTSATLLSQGQQQFNGTVTGSTNTGVNWSATLGTVSTAGLFTAPSVITQQTGSVTATAQADTTKTATARVTVNPQSMAHSVTLSWTASTTAGVTYTAYRSVTSGGPYTVIADLLSSTSYADLAVTAGNTYFYVVAADLNGAESTTSNEVTAQIPTP